MPLRAAAAARADVDVEVCEDPPGSCRESKNGILVPGKVEPVLWVVGRAGFAKRDNRISALCELRRQAGEARPAAHQSDPADLLDPETDRLRRVEHRRR